MIVDAHHHIWDPAARRHAWLDGFPALNRAFGLADFERASAPEGITASVLVQVPYLDHLLDRFGSGRLIFGSGWPVCTPAAGYGDVIALARDALDSRLGPAELKRGVRRECRHRLPARAGAGVTFKMLLMD